MKRRISGLVPEELAFARDPSANRLRMTNDYSNEALGVAVRLTEADGLTEVLGEPELVADGEGSKDGLGEGETSTTEAAGEGLAVIGCSNLFLSQTKYPAMTTNIRIMTTIVTLRFIKFSGSFV